MIPFKSQIFILIISEDFSHFIYVGLSSLINFVAFVCFWNSRYVKALLSGLHRSYHSHFDTTNFI